MVLILLAAIWAAFLLPPILRARSENRPAGSITDFRRQLRTLARTSPGGYAPPARATGGPLYRPPSLGARTRPATAAPRAGLARTRRATKRRRDIFLGLLVAMGVSAVLGFLPELRALWALNVVLDVAFAGYLAMLVYARNLAAEREMKVRYLPSASTPHPEPALAYRRSGT